MKNLIFVIVALMTLSSCGTVGDFFDESYEAEPEQLTEFKPEFEPRVAWSTDVGADADESYANLSIWLDQDMLYTVDVEGGVSSYAASTGSQNWHTDLDTRVYTGVGGGDTHVYVGTQEGNIIALNKADGKLVWDIKLSSEVLAPPTAMNNVVVVRTSDGRLTGLSTENGDKLWSYQRAVPLLSLRGASAPVIAEDKVIAGFASGKLVALSLSDGKVIWEKSIAIPRGRSELDRIVDIDATPVIDSGYVYVVTYNGKLAAVALETGDILWSREMSSRAGLDAALGDAVYVSDDDSYIWAIQDGSADALWRQTRLLRRKVTAPTIVDQNIVVGDLEGYVHWISRYDGHFVARINVGDAPIVSKPIVSNDLLYVINTDGKLTAFQVR